jgi:hypothetical protein
LTETTLQRKGERKKPANKRMKIEKTEKAKRHTEEQRKQVCRPVTFAKSPKSQVAHCNALVTSLAVPRGQGKHDELLFWYVPFGQGLHLVEPVVAVISPKAQEEQTSASRVLE